MTVSNFYRQLVASRSPLRPEMQTEIFGYAKRRKNTGLMTELLGRADLERSLEDEMRESTDLAVLTAWAMRPNRTPEELQERLLRETRVAALMPLASMTGLPETVYRTIAGIKSTKLGEVLAGNTSVPTDVRVRKVVEFASRPCRRSYGSRDLIKNLCSGEPEMLRAVARTTTIAGYLQATVESGCLTEADLDVVVRRLPEVASDDQYRSASDFSSVVAALAAVPLSATQAAAVTKVCEAFIERSAKGTHSQWAARSIAEALVKIQRRQGPLSVKLKELAVATTPEAFEAVYAEARSLVTDPDDAEMLAEAAVTHEHAPTRLLADHLGRPGRYGRSDVDLVVLRRLDARGAVAELAEALSHSSYGFDVDVLANGPAVVRTLIGLLRSRHAPVPYWVRQSKVVAANPDLAVEILPWDSLVEFLGYPDGSQVGALVQAALLEAFGEDRRLWEVFETLSAQYHGTFPELVDTVRQLA